MSRNKLLKRETELRKNNNKGGWMMRNKRIHLNATVVFVGLSVFLCLIIPSTNCQAKDILVGESDHAHLYGDSKAAGPYHVRTSLNQREGKIYVQVLNEYEEPENTDIPQIKGEIKMEDGSVKKVKFKPEAVIGRDIGDMEYSSTYYYKAKWLKVPHSIDVKIWIPVKRDRYVINFKCKAHASLPGHSGIKRL